MDWQIDPTTQAAAAACILPLAAANPAAQFPGRNLNTANWRNRVVNGHWPAQRFQTTPAQIIDSFSTGHNLEALAMVVVWGTMWRQPGPIYGPPRTLVDINVRIAQATQSIQQTDSINGAWQIFTSPPPDGLGWSHVLSSKVLHFLCRCVGIENDPPVAIDHAVILNKVWPAWRNMFRPNFNPRGWRGNGLDAYLRYMTAILQWANARGWTTTQMENTIFHEY